MNLSVQSAEIARIAEMLAPFCDGDEQLFHDMMQGESPVDQVVGRIHETVARDGEMIVGIKDRMNTLNERKARIEARAKAGKAAIGQVLRAARLAKLELPEVTYSVRDGKPTLQVIDPDAVPEEYRRFKSEPDKTAINDAFAESDVLPNWLAREPARDVVSGRAK